MTQVRVSGYVVGYDRVDQDLLWTVKVSGESDSAHRGKKFTVHSLHPGTMLTRPSVDVSFKVESVEVRGEQVLMATDVAVGEVKSSKPATDLIETDAALTFFATSTKERDAIAYTTRDTEENVRSEVANEGINETVLAYWSIELRSVELSGDPPYSTSTEALRALGVIYLLSRQEPFREAIECLVTHTFRAGLNAAN